MSSRHDRNVSAPVEAFDDGRFLASLWTELAQTKVAIRE
jgi:hypothetical protein